MHYEIMLSQDKVKHKVLVWCFLKKLCSSDIVSFLSGEIALLANYAKHLLL